MLRRMTYSEWAEELHQARGKPDWENLMGKSPGGVAADLGVSRQRVWQLAKEGKLDMILLADDAKAKVTAWLITDRSVQGLLLSRMKEQGDLLFGKPRSTKAKVQRVLAQARASRRG